MRDASDIAWRVVAAKHCECTDTVIVDGAPRHYARVSCARCNGGRRSLSVVRSPVPHDPTVTVAVETRECAK